MLPYDPAQRLDAYLRHPANVGTVNDGELPFMGAAPAGRALDPLRVFPDPQLFSRSPS